MSTTTTVGYLWTQGNGPGNSSGTMIAEPFLINTIPRQLRTSIRCCQTRKTGCRTDPNYNKNVMYRAYDTKIMREQSLHYTTCRTTKPGGGDKCRFYTDVIINTKETKIGVPDPYGLTKKELGLDATVDGQKISPIFAVVPCGGVCSRRFCTTNTNLETVNRYRSLDSKINREITDNQYCHGSTNLSQKYGFCPIFIQAMTIQPDCIDKETTLYVQTNKFMTKPITTYTIKKVVNYNQVEDTDDVMITNVVNKYKGDPGLLEITVKSNKPSKNTYRITIISGNMVLFFDIDSCSDIPNPPGNVQAIGGDRQIIVTWDAPIPNGATITGYTITLVPQGGGTPITKTVSTDINSHTFTDLLPGTYDVYVVAISDTGDSPPGTTTATVTELTPPSNGTLQMEFPENKIQLQCGPYPYTAPDMTLKLKLTINEPALTDMTITLATPPPGFSILSTPIVILAGTTSVDIPIQYNIYCTFINVPFGPFQVASISPPPTSPALITNINTAALPSVLLTYVEGVFKWESNINELPIINASGSFTTWNVNTTTDPKTIEFYAEKLEPGDGLTIQPTPTLQSNTNFNIIDFGTVPLERNIGSQLKNFKGTIDTGADCIVCINDTNLKNTFERANTFNYPIGDWDTSQVTNMSRTLYDCASFDQDLSSWNTSQVTSMTYLFYGCDIFNQDLSSWDTSQVTTMDEMFGGCEKFNQPVNSWNTSNVVTMEGMFLSCKDFDQPLNLWDTSSVTDMSSMFRRCYVFDQNLSGWNTSNVVTMESMFYLCEKFDQDLSGWDTSSVEDMHSMFYDCEKFNQDLSSWDTSKVEDMYSMFYDCEKFNQPVNSWNTSNVDDMSEMFYNCKVFNQDLTQNINAWDTSNVEDMREMFYNCEKFDQDLSSWDTSNVEDMRDMFNGCTDFDGDVTTWDTSKVEDMSGMFYNCEKFNQDLNSWVVSNVEDMREMFNGCTDFDGDVTTWDVSKVEDMRDMFTDCSDLNQILSDWQLNTVTLTLADMFNSCHAMNDNPISATLIGWADYVTLNSGNPGGVTINFMSFDFPTLTIAGTAARATLQSYGWT